MRWQEGPYLLPLFIAALLASLIAVAAWRRLHARGAMPLALFSFLIAWWCLWYGLELSALALEAKTLFAQLQYLSIAFVSLLWLLFAAQYTEHDQWVNRPRVLLLSLVPATTLLLVWSNRWHGLIWDQRALAEQGSMVVLSVRYGAWFWIHTAYSYLLLLLGSALMIRALVRFRELYRRQAAALLVAVLAPFLSNILYLFDLSPYPGLDLTPFAFTLTCLAIAWAFFRYHLLELMPVAHHVVVESIQDGVIVLDEEARVLYMNPAAERLLEMETEIAMGLPVTTFLAEAAPLLERAPEPQGSHSEAELDEGTRYLHLHLLPLRDEVARLPGWLLLLRDVTASKHTEAMLVRAKEMAEGANREKSVFLAEMSHELRTPLSSIIGYTSVLQEEAEAQGNEALLSDLEKILSAGDHLLALINNTLDLAKLEAGRMELYLETFVISVLINDVVATVLPQIKLHGNTLEVEGVNPLDLMRADQTKVRQILINLLANAAKFTEQGTIRLSVQHDGQWIEFRVSDTGIGMTKEQMAQIFEMFTQASPSTGRKYGGSGLGLTLSRQLAHLMGGEILVESELGHGSAFTLRLPVEVHVPEDRAIIIHEA